MKNIYREEFISVMVKGDWREHTEDRLTQIFTACFNSSPLIRKASFEYFGLRSDKKQWANAYINTQEANDITSRPDMKIYGGNGKLFAVIESKKDSVLDFSQLKRHVKATSQSSSFIALTFAYFEVPKPWKARLWYELFLAIENEFSLKSREEDDFICSSFLNYCERNNYMRPTELSCDTLCSASKFLSAMRLPKPSLRPCHMHGIRELDNICSFIELVFEKMKAKYSFVEKTGTCIMNLSCSDVGKLLGIKQKKSSPQNVCLVGKTFCITKRGTKKIGLYFLPEINCLNEFYIDSQIIVFFEKKDEPLKLEASWSIEEKYRKKRFLQYQNFQGVLDKSIDSIGINSFCGIVEKIIEKCKK